MTVDVAVCQVPRLSFQGQVTVDDNLSLLTISAQKGKGERNEADVLTLDGQADR